jgi:hypothetical protein
MGSPVNLPASSGGEGEHLERFIDRCVEAARAAARSELLVLSQPGAMDAARADVGVAKADPRPIFALRRSIIALEMMLAVLTSSPHGTPTPPDSTPDDTNGGPPGFIPTRHRS